MNSKTLIILIVSVVSALFIGAFIGKNYDLDFSNSSSKALEPQEVTIPLDTETNKLSYSIGALIAKNIKLQANRFGDIDYKIMLSSIESVLNEKTTLLEEQEMIEVISTAQKQLMEKEMKEKNQAGSSEMAETNKALSKDFLEENGKKSDVVTTASGLQYKVLKSSDSALKPKETDTISIHYEGRLINGKVFDSSYKRNEPATFKLNQLISGWIEGIQLMPVGSTWELYVPAELAYGKDAPPDIGPNQALIFKVELLKIIQ